MRFHIPIYICMLFGSISLNGQVVPEIKHEQKDTTDFLYYIEGERHGQKVIDLDEVVLLEKLRFKSEEERRAYLILRRKTRKVYPFAKLAAERFETMTERLEKIEKRSDKRKYAKLVQKFVEVELTDTLKKLTRSEGQILVKLVHRQTGITAYDLVKNLRSGWSAFWYNSTAKVFDISLREEYLPYYIKEDYLIEDILERAFQEDVLVRQNPVYPLDILNLADHWNTIK